MLSAMHQVQVVEVEEALIVWDLEMKSKKRDTGQKGNKSNGKIYLKLKIDKNYQIFQRTYGTDLQR